MAEMHEWKTDGTREPGVSILRLVPGGKEAPMGNPRAATAELLGRVDTHL
jgi:hypothetical protein